MQAAHDTFELNAILWPFAEFQLLGKPLSSAEALITSPLTLILTSSGLLLLVPGLEKVTDITFWCLKQGYYCAAKKPDSSEKMIQQQPFTDFT